MPTLCLRYALRFAVSGLLSLAVVACGDDPIAVRGSLRPGATCEVTNDCAIGFECTENICAQVEPHRITLSWTVDTDFDLHVRTPNGQELYFNGNSTQAWLAADDCYGTSLPNSDAVTNACSDEDGVHYEDAFLLNLYDDTLTTQPRLDYEYWVENYDCDTAGDFEIVVMAQDNTAEDEIKTGTLPAACADSEHFKFTTKY